MQYETKAAQAVGDLTTYAVANLANANAKNDEALIFWDSLRDALAEAIDYAGGQRPDDDTIAEIADNAPDVYNDTRMMEALGTGCYLEECPFGCYTHDNMVTFAGHVLVETARVAVEAMLDEVGLSQQ
jgi:hypothetical protein